MCMGQLGELLDVFVRDLVKVLKLLFPIDKLAEIKRFWLDKYILLLFLVDFQRTLINIFLPWLFWFGLRFIFLIL